MGAPRPRAYVLKAALHDGDDAPATDILRRVRAVIREGDAALLADAGLALRRVVEAGAGMLVVEGAPA